MKWRGFIKKSKRIMIRNFMDLHTRAGEKARRVQQIESGYLTEHNGLRVT